MKSIIILAFILALCFTSCHERPRSNVEYSLTTIQSVPDSLKEKQRGWILETVRASNQHLSAGDYEDIDGTIIQVERTANDLFANSEWGLRKLVKDKQWVFIEIKPSDFSTYEKKVFDSLTK